MNFSKSDYFIQMFLMMVTNMLPPPPWGLLNWPGCALMGWLVQLGDVSLPMAL